MRIGHTCAEEGMGAGGREESVSVTVAERGVSFLVTTYQHMII